MIKIDTSNWKKFKIGELFECNIAKSLDFGKLEKGDTVFIGRTSMNNGVQGKVNAPPCEKGNCITVSMVGDSRAFYQPKEFAASQNILILRNKRLNKKNGLFFVTLINSLLAKYNYSNTVKKKEFINETIPLPVTPDGTPDFDYMENYMKEITKLAVKRVEKVKEEKPQTKIDTSNWKKFKVGELFECNIAKSLDFGKLEKGNTIFIGRTSTNNGVQGEVNASPCEKGNCITVSMVGDNRAFYQSKEFAASQNILILRNKRLNEKNGLFFVTLINSLLAKYNYSNTVKKKEFINETILLPVVSENTPDFDYMENYMKNLTEKAKKKLSNIPQ